MKEISDPLNNAFNELLNALYAMERVKLSLETRLKLQPAIVDAMLLVREAIIIPLEETK